MARDALELLLTTLEVRLHAFALAEIAAGKRLLFGGIDAVIVHYVVDGTGMIETAGNAGAALAPGSIAIAPPGLSHSLSGTGGPVQDVPARDRGAMLADGLIRFDAAGGGEGDLRVASGTIAATHGGSFGLFDTLKRPIVADMAGAEPVERAMAIIRDERSRPGIGTHALIEALMKEWLVLMLRDQLTRSGESPLFARLIDPRLTRAVMHVIEQPAAAHSVDRLAAAASMSRSAFAKKFHDVYNQTPMDFVARARLHRAAALLIGTGLPVTLVAASLGYASRSHFSRAFRASYGEDPSGYRRKMAECRNDPPRRALSAARA